ncbi:MAG TPA: hypothetical protein VLJ79_25705, partial [Candidatus Binatia bacterium]|nr:hypothetical protein [Candidatus Binatia bacterium]
EAVRYYKTHRAEAVKKIMALSKLPERQMAETVYEGSLRATPDDAKPTLRGHGSRPRRRGERKPESEKHDGAAAIGSAVHSLKPVMGPMDYSKR